MGNLPGVEWVAAGFSFHTMSGLSEKGGLLARRYLRRGWTFTVEAQGKGRVLASDLTGALTAAVLDEVVGARVAQEGPTVTFRVVSDGRSGAVGVQLMEGPGGRPTATSSAVCLVSGGKHSSVLAWLSLLSGLRVRLVHSWVDVDAMRSVAGLYAELSHRADPTAVSLEVLRGAKPGGGLRGFVGGMEGLAFAGFNAGGPRIPRWMEGRVASPLYLLPEQEFDRYLERLRLTPRGAAIDWREAGRGRSEVRKFGGGTAEPGDVLDSIYRLDWPRRLG